MRALFAPAFGASILVAAGLIALPAQPAAAASRFLPLTLSAHTDSDSPKAAFPLSSTDQAPIGAWLDADGDKHVSRAYYTFDLSPLAGRQITEATISLEEKTVADCTRSRAIEVWRVAATSTAPTWKRAPKQLTRAGVLASSPAQCPSHYLFTDVAAVLRAAQAEKAASVTLMLRVPDDQEGKVAAGRRVVNVGIQTVDNRPPATPGQLGVSGLVCTPDGIFVGTRTPKLWAQIEDPDFPSDSVTATVAYWPVVRPTERTELTQDNLSFAGPVQMTVPGELTEGEIYAFAVQATDRAGAKSVWSAECRFTVDTRVPRAPKVSSDDYPGPAAGGPGIPGTFTITSDPRDNDVVGFRWLGSNGPGNEVPLEPDGTATVEFTPTFYGTQRLEVQAIDRTRNRSAVTTYEFQVRLTEPIVTDHNPEGQLFEPRSLTFAPRMPDVAEYTYWLNDGDKTTVPAGTDGTATVTVTPDQVGTTEVHVISRTTSGQLSTRTDYRIHVPTAPTVTSPDFPEDGSDDLPLVGEQVTFTFHPGMAGVTEYVWKVNGRAEQVVQADADGTATVTWTERDDSNITVQVTSRTADGLESEATSSDFILRWHAPTVQSADYREWGTSGGPGIAGTFSFSPAYEGVTAYTWRLDDGQEHTIPAAADGTATLTWTPTAEQTGWHTLTVREHVGDIISNPMTYEFGVATPES
ncbi:hypothetical protein AFR_41130 [Actinoplanes friuliensis DSM 7358]|uniref:Uncharacterized protein n=1 Tax=Actinoplanes friuliensis DSM 7358 TaxID=1246995 RepID=U5WEK8_9ACTN|nr:hypothetical protein AFR_41130 [Actinoplanes friuliensis DSM 7358]